MGNKIVTLEADQEYQEAVTSVHHGNLFTLQGIPAAKITENHEGIASILTLSGGNRRSKKRPLDGGRSMTVGFTSHLALCAIALIRRY